MGLKEWFDKNVALSIGVLIIDEKGFPIFEYPPLKPKSKSIESDDEVLISGLLTAIDSFGKKVLGDEVQVMIFNTLYLSFSRDKWGYLYVFIFKNPPEDTLLLQQLHVEMMALFHSKIKSLLQITQDFVMNIKKEGHQQSDDLKSIMDPFLCNWRKKLFNNLS